MWWWWWWWVGGCIGQRLRLALAQIEMELRAEQSLSILFSYASAARTLTQKPSLHKYKSHYRVKYPEESEREGGRCE